MAAGMEVLHPTTVNSAGHSPEQGSNITKPQQNAHNAWGNPHCWAFLSLNYGLVID